MKTICPYCALPVYRDMKSVTFSSGQSPIVTLEVVIEAEYCPRPSCYQRIKLRNYYDHSRGEFVDEVVRFRDAVQPIADGMVTRGCRVSQYDLEPGKRKATIKDAQHICKAWVERINKAVNKFTEDIFQ